MTDTYLEIHVHSVDGYVSAFAQNDTEKIQQVINQMQPGRIFTQPYLAMAGSSSLTVFPSSKVVRLDLLTCGFPNWPFHYGIRDAAELSEEEYRHRIPDISGTRASSGAIRSLYAEIEMTNGERIYLEMQIYTRNEPTTRTDFGKLLQLLLSAPSFHARRLGGGVLVINTAHLLRVRFHPAPLQPPNAWSADPIME